MRVPGLKRTKEVPVRTTQEGPQDDQYTPKHDKAKEKGRYRKRPLFEGIVAVALLIEVDIGQRDQAVHDHSWQHDARHPWVIVDEHFLQAEEVPRGLRRIGNARR